MSRELHLAAEQAADDARDEAAHDRATDPRRFTWADESYAGVRSLPGLGYDPSDDA